MQLRDILVAVKKTSASPNEAKTIIEIQLKALVCKFSTNIPWKYISINNSIIRFAFPRLNFILTNGRAFNSINPITCGHHMQYRWKHL